MSTPLNRLLSALPTARPSAGGNWSAKCPAHDDRVKSLSVKEGEDGRVLVHCHAGCDTAAIVAAVGLTLADLYDPATRRVPGHRTWRIPLPDGRTVEHERIDQNGGGKRFTWAVDGVPTLHGIPVDTVPLYGADRLNGATRVVITEGEYACDALTAAIERAGISDLAVVATVTGASKIPSAAVLEVLRDRRCWPWPDNDPPGQKHMADLTEALKGMAAEIRVVRWAQAPDKGDAADWVALGGTAEELIQLLREAAREDIPEPPPAEASPRVYTIAEARLRVQETLEHLPVLGADGFIVKGWSHLLAGWWRLGKSELMAAIILPWLRRGLRITWITEEPDSVWADRADAFEEIYQGVPWENLTLVDALSAPPAALLDYAAGAEGDVVILDTIRECCGIESMTDDADVHRAMSPWLRRLRDGRRTLICLAQHRKAAGERGERVLGSVALPSKFDAVLELEAVEGQERQRRLTIRRRRSQTPPLLYEMDSEDRLIVIPDGRSRTRVEAESAALAVVVASTEPLTTVEVRRAIRPTPSRDTVLRALTSLAESGRILRRPPLSEVCERRTVKWLSAALSQLHLPQNFQNVDVQIGAADGLAADLISGGCKICRSPTRLRASTGGPKPWCDACSKWA